MPADGVSTVVIDSAATRIVSGSGHQPSWRSGADQVLHVATASGRDPGLCLSAPDGTNARSVTTPVGAEGPVLSPDGTQLAVRAGVGGPRVGLVVGPIDTPSRRSILEGADITSLSWLGSSMIVACLTPSGAGARLVKVPAAGGPAVTVRDGCSAPASGSPDGTRIAITTPTSLDVIEGDGKIITLPRTGLLAQPPAWSPGSDRLVYAYSDEGGRALGLFDINKSVANQIVRGEGDQPAFSPKGDRIAYTGRTSAGSPRQLLTLTPTGGAPKVVTTCGGRCLLPRGAWSSDGASVVLDSTPGT